MQKTELEIFHKLLDYSIKAKESTKESNSLKKLKEITLKELNFEQTPFNHELMKAQVRYDIEKIEENIQKLDKEIKEYKEIIETDSKKDSYVSSILNKINLLDFNSSDENNSLNQISKAIDSLSFNHFDRGKYSLQTRSAVIDKIDIDIKLFSEILLHYGFVRLDQEMLWWRYYRSVDKRRYSDMLYPPNKFYKQKV